MVRRITFATALLAAALLIGVSGPSLAQTEPEAETATEEQGTLVVELNKVEQLDNACRAYLLFENGQDSRFDEFRLDLVLFDGEGVIARRIAVEAAPLRAGRSVVKLFDLADLQCQTIDRVLLNDISPCADEAGPRDDCVDLVELRSRSDIEFFQ